MLFTIVDRARHRRPLGAALPWLGRFGTSDLHRTAALTGTGLVAAHVGSLLLDPYAQLKLVDFVFPFLGAYRPLWLGLGTLALDLLGVVTVVSLLRHRVGPHVFKAVHWATYALWPIALLHALGSGTDAATWWFRAIAVVCVSAVVTRGRLAPPRRTPAAAGSVSRAPLTPASMTPLTDPPAPDPAGTRRLADRAPLGPLPDLRARRPAARWPSSGLTGRGGAGFPTAIKVRAVAEGDGGRSSSATRWRASRSATRTPCCSPATRTSCWTG